MKRQYEEPEITVPEITGDVLTESPTKDNEETFPAIWDKLLP